MAYQSLYRKYRPQTFADVVGQGHVVRTLQNALISGRVAHGYLFTGTRGTAKTTVARLLAKTLNCESATHPVAEPCNVCDACRSITAGSAVDVIEMDAASHRGVSDIEEVRRAVGYGPMQLRYKVFIIDEAHQLSSDAKDAFLKTLEEPPANVVFILATTEPQAIPITIRSRCQQFDFKRGSIAEITSRLRYVLDCEGVSYTPDAVTLVARGAEGSYRDSLSLLEQVLAFTPTQVTAPDVEMVLGSLDAEMLSKVVHAVAERNAPETFALAGQILDAGKEARTLLRTLSLHFRDLMLVSVGGPAVAAEMTPDEVQRLQGEARFFTPQQMMKAMDILNEAQGETRWNNQHRLLTELTFLKLMNLGGESGAGHEFVTAPIIFEPSSLRPVEKAVSLPASQLITPPPIPVAVSVPPPVIVSEAPPLTPVVSLTPNPSPSEGRGESGSETAPTAASGSPLPSEGEGLGVRATEAIEPKADEIAAIDYFATDDAEADSDEIEDYGFAPIGDADVPEDLFDAPVVAKTLPTPIVKPVAAPLVTAEPATVAAEPEEWKLFADDPQPGPGLFEDSIATVPVAPLTRVPRLPEAPVTGATPEAPPPQDVPPPLESEEGVSSHPTSRERIQQPPALSLENAEEIAVPVTPAVVPVRGTPTPAASSTFEDEPDSNEPPVTLMQVKGEWNNFLRQTERFSRMTYMYLQQAEPTQVAGGRTVVLTIHHRPYYEMLIDKPKAQAFMKKLLARVLRRETIGIRIELDPTQAVSQRQRRVAESPDKKKRYDRLTALDAPDSGIPAYSAAAGAAAPTGGTGFGFSGGQGYEQVTVAPLKPSSFASVAPAPVPRDRTSFVREASPEMGFTPQTEPVLSVSHADKRSLALAEPLVQEVLTIFGGDIVLD